MKRQTNHKTMTSTAQPQPNREKNQTPETPIPEEEIATIQQYGDFPVIRVVLRDLMSKHANILRQIIRKQFQQGNHYMIIDLSEVRYIDSAGLSALLLGHRLCRDAGGVFVVAGAHGWTDRIIRISELHRVLHMVETVKQGVEYLLLTRIQKDIEREGEDEL